MDVSEMLPHRPPMLLVDEARDIEPGRRLTGLRAVRADQDWYAGGFAPYLVLESWLQSAAVLVAGAGPQPRGVALLGGLRDVRFGRPALAGETLAHQVEIIRSVGDVAICEGTTTAGGEVILQVGQATVTVRDRHR